MVDCEGWTIERTRGGGMRSRMSENGHRRVAIAVV
jgi:hypothetical protein